MTERIFLAGATGVIGSRLVPLLIGAGHTVGAMTRSSDKADRLSSLGAEPIICDVFDRTGLADAVRAFSPDVVLHELTDLPDAFEDLPRSQKLNARIREEAARAKILSALFADTIHAADVFGLARDIDGFGGA